LKEQFLNLLSKPVADGGYGKTSDQIAIATQPTLARVSMDWR